MVQSTEKEDEFTWTGTLEQCGIGGVYERCQRLRLTGRLLLQDGGRIQVLLWQGGQAMGPEGEGEVTVEELASWERGHFRAVQGAPDLDGQVTEQTSVEGPIQAGDVSRLGRLCADFRLSADVHLAHPAGEVRLRFTHGRAESAHVDGTAHPPLQVLAQISTASGAWEGGRYRLALRPLFGAAAPRPAPPLKQQRSAREFDLTGAVHRGAVFRPAGTSPRQAVTVSLPSLAAAAEEPTLRGAATQEATEVRGLPVGGARQEDASGLSVSVSLSTSRRPLLRAAVMGVIGGLLAVSIAAALRLLPPALSLRRRRP
jgi:hypothetical protein